MAASTRFLCVLVLVGLCLAAVQAQQDFMFVIGDDQPNTEDQFFTNYFTAMGYTYTVVKDEDTTTADAANYNAILISETSTANEVGDKFRDVPQAVVIYEYNLYDDMDMANPDDRTRPAIEILDNTHPITLGLPLGPLTIFDRNQRHAAGNVGGQSTATILATTDNRASLYVYEQGDTLSDGSLAPGIRMGLPLYRDSQSHLTIEGDALIKRAIDYVVTPPTTTTTSTTAPPNGGDGGDIDGDGDVDLDDLLNADSVGDIVNGITGNATYLYGAIGAAVVLLIGICLCCFCCCTKRCCCQNRDGSDGSKRLHDAEYLGTSALEGDSMAMTSTGVVLSEEPYGDSVGSTALASSDPRPGRKPRDRSVAKSGDEFLLADSDEWSDTSAHRAPPRVPKTSKPVAAKPARTGDMDTRHDSMAPPKPSR